MGGGYRNANVMTALKNIVTDKAELYSINFNQCIPLKSMCSATKGDGKSFYHDQFHKIYVGHEAYFGENQNFSVQCYDINKDEWTQSLRLTEFDGLSNAFFAKSDPNILLFV